MFLVKNTLNVSFFSKTELSLSPEKIKDAYLFSKKIFLEIGQNFAILPFDWAAIAWQW